ncbi:MAG: protein-(glutamine-N5) methyltransferase, release factor-specific [Candidatus Rokubacteria bacterium RIFCSPHIGHO2_12_FULL_73_22]|nr:MAG: protein-(glutamine-N5) methyltransferase, release factor-specific [Candidatus Rokubacteria bacterium RIFCSPHIGHO2_02_FULL_73_26]OGL04459.1 MAG: protein-(glutamine-N5) methyltransferase, release factor-specific [Candidatus Rokubacteria bacterium RIFCSPHIGHO2_12_FULL_73_22]OGL08993.1 MAG: protein-(glutamine-N5) methyltransferase, release factor-specific [Candidatus Rokubacteria bacterium RIFCSPLOWO2_02_FULL_73_56]OGL25097.1 MAG: protein-(glutamine-N5) methyltransferase, release factor-spec
MATLRDGLDAAARALAAAGIATPRVDAEWLLAGLLGVGRATLALALDRAVSAPLAARYGLAVRRRAGREPLQQILGWEEFRGLRIRVTRDVLVPRPETEALVEWALGLLPAPRAGVRPLALDLGTGSGCIACALARERADLEVLAVDNSPAAAVLARENARALGVAARVRVVVGDLLEPVGPRPAALIVSNPPYLPSDLVPTLEPEVRSHEPLGALDGGGDGLALIRRIVAGARGRLRPGGALVLETAGRGQAPEVAALLDAAGFGDVAVREDLAGVSRLVAGRA